MTAPPPSGGAALQTPPGSLRPPPPLPWASNAPQLAGSGFHKIVKGGGIVGGDLSGTCTHARHCREAGRPSPSWAPSLLPFPPVTNAHPHGSTGGTGGGGLSADGNRSALGTRFFRDEGFIIPHSAPGA